MVIMTLIFPIPGMDGFHLRLSPQLFSRRHFGEEKFFCLIRAHLRTLM
jgi:hypothetical protein